MKCVVMLFSILCPELLILAAISTANSREVFYQQVEGNCSDLHEVKNYRHHKMATGHWFHQYASYGEEGDRCATAHLIERGTQNYIDFLLYNPQDDRYELFPDDAEYHPETSGIYLTSSGAVAHILSSDAFHGVFIFQCREQNGQTAVTAFFATRERQISDEEQAVYDATIAKLKSQKLLPKIHRVLQTDCPPEYKIKHEKNL